MARTRDDFSRALSRLKSADDKYKMMDVFTWFTRSLLARHPWLDDEKESSNQGKQSLYFLDILAL